MVELQTQEDSCSVSEHILSYFHLYDLLCLLQNYSLWFILY